MKERMYNTFYRITKIKALAKILAFLGYKILILYYYIARLFLKEKLTISKEEALKKVNKLSPKPKLKNDSWEEIALTKKETDLSIIVPAYNASDYIKECIESVLKQKTSYDYELIVINDGSKDDTLNKINSFKDNHLKIINQENKGFSGARNRGINIARGKYIMFLDSDDILCENAIEILLKKAYEKNIDIVQGSYYTFNKNKEKFYSKIKIEEINKNDDKPINMPGFPWGKIYKSELFNEVRFPEGYWYEDTIVNYLLSRKSRKYLAISNCVYGYRINPKGITITSKKSNKVTDSYWIVEQMINESKRLNLNIDKETYEMTIIHLSSILYRRIHVLGREEMKNIFILASYLMENIGIRESKEKTRIFRDIEKAFKEKNYSLWKMASFLI